MGNKTTQLLPVLFGFFIMGFCDIVGIATSYVQTDFNINETTAGLLPSMVFVWFLLLSLPASLLMNRIGRKRTVIVSNIITIIGMILPTIDYSFTICMGAFLLLGAGNTILQVSLNPLLTNIVDGNELASSLTAGQVIKALSSFCGPLIAAFAVAILGNWQYIFPIYALLTIISTIWLQLTPIAEEPAEKGASYRDTIALLGNGKIMALFLGIFFIVGVDVGTNTVAPKLLIERCGFAVEDAGYASSVYFVCRTAGAFIGTLVLTRVAPFLYMRINIVAAIASLAVLFLVSGVAAIMTCIGLIGLFCSSIFPIIYSKALEAYPDKGNEISGLMIMGVFGGAVIPPLMGLCADTIGNQTGSLIVIALSMSYLLYCSLAFSKSRTT